MNYLSNIDTKANKVLSDQYFLNGSFSGKYEGFASALKDGIEKGVIDKNKLSTIIKAAILINDTRLYDIVRECSIKLNTCDFVQILNFTILNSEHLDIIPLLYDDLDEKRRLTKKELLQASGFTIQLEKWHFLSLFCGNNKDTEINLINYYINHINSFKVPENAAKASKQDDNSSRAAVCLLSYGIYRDDVNMLKIGNFLSPIKEEFTWARDRYITQIYKYDSINVLKFLISSEYLDSDYLYEHIFMRYYQDSSGNEEKYDSLNVLYYLFSKKKAFDESLCPDVLSLAARHQNFDIFKKVFNKAKRRKNFKNDIFPNFLENEKWWDFEDFLEINILPLISDNKDYLQAVVNGLVDSAPCSYLIKILDHLPESYKIYAGEHRLDSASKSAEVRLEKAEKLQYLLELKPDKDAGYFEELYLEAARTNEFILKDLLDDKTAFNYIHNYDRIFEQGCKKAILYGNAESLRVLCSHGLDLKKVLSNEIVISELTDCFDRAGEINYFTGVSYMLNHDIYPILKENNVDDERLLNLFDPD